MTNGSRSPYLSLAPYVHLVALIALLAGIGWIGVDTETASRARSWLWILALMTAFAVVAGHAITGNWRGILIDSRNKMSLSRLQIVAWTLVVLSALFMAILSNIGLQSPEPLAVTVPSELWVLMGISTGSAVAAPAILASKRGRQASASELQKTVNQLAKQGYTGVAGDDREVVLHNVQPEAARWADMLKGDEAGNASVVDVGKLQMFLFTFILVISYCTAIAAQFRAAGTITGLPAVQEGMNVLLGISHVGYLANKGVSHTHEEA